MEPQTFIARRIARELSEGMLVNLGIGIQALVASFLPEGVSVFFESENGLIGTGAPPELGLSSGSATGFSVVSQSLAMRSENRCCLHFYAEELYAFCAVFT